MHVDVDLSGVSKDTRFTHVSHDTECSIVEVPPLVMGYLFLGKDALVVP